LNDILGQKVQNPAKWHKATQREHPLAPRGETWSRVGLQAEEGTGAATENPRLFVARAVAPSENAAPRINKWQERKSKTD